MTALDQVLEAYRDAFGVKSDRANEIHRDACIEVARLREAAQPDADATLDLRARLERAEGVMRQLEWPIDNVFLVRSCPICKGDHPNHDSDCELAAALAGEGEGTG